MANIEAITPQRHSKKFWRQNDNLKFARQDSFCQIVLAELPQAIMSLPVCFVLTEGRYQLVMLQGLQTASNLATDENGAWRFGYVPALYRAYPFLLANSSDQEKILCINTDSGLVTDDASDQAFFNSDGTPTKRISETLEFLSKFFVNGLATENACNLLQEHELIEPWPMTIHDGDGEQNIGGLFRIREPALATLTPEVLAKLRDAGALSLAYAQLFSMQRICRLEAEIQRGAESKLASNIDFDFMQDNGSISFGNL